MECRVGRLIDEAISLIRIPKHVMEIVTSANKVILRVLPKDLQRCHGHSSFFASYILPWIWIYLKHRRLWCLQHFEPGFSGWTGFKDDHKALHLITQLQLRNAVPEALASPSSYRLVTRNHLSCFFVPTPTGLYGTGIRTKNSLK